MLIRDFSILSYSNKKTDEYLCIDKRIIHKKNRIEMEKGIYECSMGFTLLANGIMTFLDNESQRILGLIFGLQFILFGLLDYSLHPKKRKKRKK